MGDLIEQMSNLEILPNSLAIWGMGQMGFAVKGPGATLYIDACLSDVVAELFGDWWYRAYPPPVEPDEVTNADYYFVSHEHLDHLDPTTVGAIAKSSPQARFVTTGWCVEELHKLDIDDERIILPPALETMTLPGSDIQVTPIPGAHYEKEYSEEKGYRWLGFIIEWNGVRLYHAGDTIIYHDYIETLQRFPKLDVAIVPVNGRDYYREAEGVIGNLMPIEAATLAHELEWDLLIPGHNDLYPNNAIPMGEIIHAIETVAPRQKTKILQPGELLYYVKL